MISVALMALSADLILAAAHAEEATPSARLQAGRTAGSCRSTGGQSPISRRAQAHGPAQGEDAIGQEGATRSAGGGAAAAAAAAGAPASRPERGLGPVQGYAARQSVTGTKTDTPILEVPQSISVVTRDQIVQQQAQTVPEIVRYTPGVSTELYGANSVADEIKVRGFVAPRFLDGLRLPYDTVLQFAQTKTEPYGLERLEILKAPSSGIYGHSSPGGMVNMVSKRPTDFYRGEVELQTGSFERLQGGFDLSGPLDEQRKFLCRIVGLVRDTDRVVDFNHEQRLFIAPSFTWLPTPDTRITILSSFQHDDLKGQPQQYLPGVGTLIASPLGRIPYSRNAGEPNFDRIKFDQVMAGYEFTHRFNEVFELRQNVRYGTVRNEVYSMRNETGNPVLLGGGILRSANYVFGDVKNLAADTHVQADFRTGPAVHKVLVGVDYQKQNVAAEYRSSFGGFGPFAFGFPLNIYAPVYGQPIPGKDAQTPFFNTVTDQYQPASTCRTRSRSIVGSSR